MRTVAQLDEAFNQLMAAGKVAEAAQLMPIKLDAQKTLVRRFHGQAYVSRTSYRWHVLLPFTRCTPVVFRDPADFSLLPFIPRSLAPQMGMDSGTAERAAASVRRRGSSIASSGRATSTAAPSDGEPEDRVHAILVCENALQHPDATAWRLLSPLLVFSERLL